MIQSPCYKCLNRYIGCHSLCEKYFEFKVKKDRENQNHRNELLRNSFTIEGIDRYKKLKKIEKYAKIYK